MSAERTTKAPSIRFGNHLPGPWDYTQTGTTSFAITYGGGHTVANCETLLNSTAHSRMMETARLFAAAPRLLTALQTLLFACRDGAVLPRDHAHQEASAAIALAIGRTK